MANRIPTRIRAGVFSHVAAAEGAIRGLEEAGFVREEISVVCSDEARDRHFGEFDHPRPAGTHAPLTTAVGSTIGAILGGVTAAAGLATGVGLPAVAAGALFAAGGGGVAGGLIGALMSRGVEPEIADYYDQAVTAGNILVAVEPRNIERLAEAERVLQAAGARPLELPEG